MKFFKDKVIQMKMVNEVNTPTRPPTMIWTPYQYNEIIKTAARATSGVIAVYVGVDILRKVVIYVVSSKI